MSKFKSLLQHLILVKDFCKNMFSYCLLINFSTKFLLSFVTESRGGVKEEGNGGEVREDGHQFSVPLWEGGKGGGRRATH